MRWLLGLAFFAGVSLVTVSPVHAESTLGVQPLQYTESLQKGERKRAFIDVTNPSSQPMLVQFSVQAFKQVDDKGTLSFYDDSRINDGVLLDYTEKEIPANKTLRLFFIVDGAKLPTGDIFAAVFAHTKPDQKAVAPSVRIGTLLMVTNGTPGARQAEVTSFTVPVFNFGESISGEIKIKNTAPANTSSGFMPKVDIRTWPFGPAKTITGPLIFAGNTRTVTLELPSNQFGIYKITASHGASEITQWVVLVTGVWRWIVPVFTLLMIVGLFLFKKRHFSR